MPYSLPEAIKEPVVPYVPLREQGSGFYRVLGLHTGKSRLTRLVFAATGRPWFEVFKI